MPTLDWLESRARRAFPAYSLAGAGRKTWSVPNHIIPVDPAPRGRSPARPGRICPYCGTRRMHEAAAHLVDNVIPKVPVRQWVLSFPIPLRALFAVHPELLAPILQIIHRAIATFLIDQTGIKRDQASTDAVTLIQRFGSATSDRYAENWRTPAKDRSWPEAVNHCGSRSGHELMPTTPESVLSLRPHPNPPSSRITSPFNTSSSMMCFASAAYSSGRPSPRETESAHPATHQFRPTCSAKIVARM